jgi:hypothetical protein
MECRDVEAVLEQEGLSPLPAAAREHLVGCEGCRELVADLSAIAVAAKRIPAEENPPERIWVSLRAQLEGEGVIRRPRAEIEPAGVSSWQGFAQLLRPRALAMIGTGVLAAAGAWYYAVSPNSVAPNRAKSLPPATTPAPAPAVSPAEAATSVSAPLKPAAPVLSAGNARKRQPDRTVPPEATAPPSQIHESTTDLRPSPTELASFGESAATLNQTERAMPSGGRASNAEVDAALRTNLRTLNEFIKECETRLRENPRDQLTQEYLNMALQQKAELLNAMMDSGRSEH